MSHTNTVALTVAVILGAGAGLGLAGEKGSPKAVRFATGPTAKTSKGKTVISFALSAKTDVEVAILDAKGKVIRHLAAGVLGNESPPPVPLKPGLSQSFEWDGKDDFGRLALSERSESKGPFKVRVRAGMGAKLVQIVGGDPYAYYSKEMGQGDHAAWRITGMEAKADGKVYVLGNADNYGPPALRAYNADGSYVRTVYPPPAGMKPEQVKGWGTIQKADGTYTFAYNDLSSPALSRTLICGTRGRIANLIPSPGKDQLWIESGYKVMKINTDSSIPAEAATSGLLVKEPAIVHPEKNGWKVPWRVSGQMQVCAAPDGRHVYLGGLHARTVRRLKEVAAEKTGAWRDGQVFKVDTTTGKAEVFFSLSEDSVISSFVERGKSPIADAKYGKYSALQGVAADAEGHVFICDRLNKRLLVLDSDGKKVREIPMTHPDAVAVKPGSKTLYVTTRYGHFHGKGKLTLLKFADWSKDTAAVSKTPLCDVHHFSQATRLAVAQSEKGTFVWIAYSALPVRVYREKGSDLELVKDFYRDAWQRALDLQHFLVDPKTERVYVADGFNNCFKLTDWKKPNFERLVTGDGRRIGALSMSIDARGRYLYCHQDRRPVVRYRIDGDKLTPDIPGGAKAPPPSNGKKNKRAVQGGLTPQITNDWRIGLGMGDRGIAAAPDGSVATMNALGTKADYGGYLRFFRADNARHPWGEGLLFKSFGSKVRSGGARFDLKGNLYAGKIDGKPGNPPKGFEKYRGFTQSTGRIYKFAPTGKLGDLFPKEPAKPAKVYDIHYGVIGPSFSRTPRFGVDGWGRIYYPTSLLPRVSVIDNEGNAILAFGTYGNRDSMGGLKGERVSTGDVPMAYPNCVDATDDYIYVSDIVNIRLLRLAKTFAAEDAVAIK